MVIEIENGRDERVASSLDVCDASVAELAILECLANSAHVHPEGSLLHDDVRPNIIDEFFLSDDLAGTLGEVDQNVQRPAAEGKYFVATSQDPFPA
jgi:hypothetical protein